MAQKIYTQGNEGRDNRRALRSAIERFKRQQAVSRGVASIDEFVLDSLDK